jgi:hypothetical protein
MNNTVYVDATLSDDERRQRIFEGQVFLYTPRPSTVAFIRFARQLIEEAFAPRDPETAQFDMSVEAYADLLGKLKPHFIHHPESKRHLQAVLEEMGCDLAKTYFDVPKMRSSTSDGYLTSGIAYAWHPHRDTWYSAPPCQINWWIPIYDFQSDNAMAFHPKYWNRAVRNSSSGYNYYQWNRLYRGPSVAKLTKEDPRPLPRAVEPIEVDPQIRLVCPAGGVIMFSGAQMHSSVPNTSGKTRFSFDFRMVHIDDVAARRGAPRVDEECTGTTMRDYLRGTDFAHLPEELVSHYDDGTTADGELIYRHRC